MNIENLTKLRDTLITERALGKDAHMGFNMADLSRGVNEYYPDHLNTCGTTACLAGWCFAIQHPELANKNGHIEIPSFRSGVPIMYPNYETYSPSRAASEAAQWLEIDKDEAEELFGFSGRPMDLSLITLDRALQHLDAIIAAGEFKCWDETVAAV